MRSARYANWTWTLRRLAVSAFLAVHLGTTVLWVLPPCPLRARIYPALCYYILPLGLWQYWGMFAPDPMRDTLTLEAEVVDARGLRYNFAFPKLADFSKWRGVPRFRHSKFAANLSNGDPDFDLNRKVAAKHAARQVGVPEGAFPIHVSLVFQVRPTPPPGTAVSDPMAPTRPHVMGSFRFANADEVRP